MRTKIIVYDYYSGDSTEVADTAHLRTFTADLEKRSVEYGVLTLAPESYISFLGLSHLDKVEYIESFWYRIGA